MDVAYCEGFRMPAIHVLAWRRAGVRKPKLGAPTDC